MRRVLIIGLLFLLMYLLRYQEVRVDTPFDPKSLATIGFILLAAYTFGELTNAFGLPKITGYIATGVLFGPYVINLFSVTVVNDLDLINGLAIGLIALTAGAEMKISGLKAVARSLTYLVLIKGLLILIAVTGAVFFARPLIGFLAMESVSLVLSVGLIFGVLAIGTSPSVTIAVINETGAKGRLSDITLGLAVAKDVIMVILLAVAISLAKLFSTAGATFDPAVLILVGEELLLSILAGSVLGGIIIAYIRFVHAEMWLFIVGLIFFATVAAHQFHLEALLMFIAAGFVVQNLSKYGDEFIHPVEEVSLPVYVVFFSIAGAGLDLNAVKQVWKIALVLVVVRVIAIYAGTFLAVKLAKEPPRIKKNAWLAFISQAGVVLGLSIIVQNNLPGLGSEIQTIVLATIGFNLLLGPVAFKAALSRAGEIKDEEDALASEPPVEEEIAEVEEVIPKRSALPAEIHLPTPQFADEGLNRLALKLREDLLNVQRDFAETLIDAQTSRWQDFITRMQEQYLEALNSLKEEVTPIGHKKDQSIIDKFRTSRSAYSRWLLQEITRLISEDSVARSKDAFRELFGEIDDLSEATSARIIVVQEEERFLPAPGDSMYVRARKRLKRFFRALRNLFGSGAEIRRTIDFRGLARYYFSGTLPLQMPKVANFIGGVVPFALKRSQTLYARIDDTYEACINYLEKPGDISEQKHGSDDLLEKMGSSLNEDFDSASADIAHYGNDIKRLMTFSLADRYGEFLKDLEIAGTFELRSRSYRYSKIYEAREKAKKEISRSFDVWRKYHTGAAGAYCKHIEVVILMDSVSRAVNETVFKVLEGIDERIIARILAMKKQCEQSSEEIARAFDSNHSVAELREEIARQKESITGFVRSDTLERLKHLRDSRELSAFVDTLLQRFSTLADDTPLQYVVLDEKDIDSITDDGLPPDEVDLKAVPMRDITRSYLESEIARELANVNRIMFEQVDETIQAVTEVSQIINFNLRACLEELKDLTEETYGKEDAARLRELSLGGINRATGRLDATVKKVNELREQVYTQIIAQVDNRMRDLETLILKRTSFDIKVKLKQRQAIAQSYRFFGQAWNSLKYNYKKLIVRYRPIGQEVVKDLKSSLGLQQFSPSEILEIYDQAILDRGVIENLPFIYQRLFDIAPLEAGDFLVARDQELKMVETAKQRWQQGMHCGVAVIGELGSGKTSFINAMLKEVLGDYPVYQKEFSGTVATEKELVRELAEMLGIPNAGSFDDIEARLRQMPQKSIIVLEDAHHLYLRTLGGFDTIRKLLLLIAGTSNQVLWVISMRKYGWLYLDEVLNISDYFTFVVNTENLLPRQLEKLILTRHKVSGFDLNFLPSEVMKQRKKYRRASEEERQEILKKEFFEELSRASEGNALAAIFYWLKSIAASQNNSLLINPLRRLQFDFLWDMQVEKLLTLSMIIQHGNLTAEEHAKIFGTDAESSLSTLTYLANINLLTKKMGEDGQYRFAVSRVIYIPLAKELRTRNIVH